MDYLTMQLQKEKEFENACGRCGNCCGRQEDPCMHLLIQADGLCICDVYFSRGGMQKTRSGKFFECVSIRDILHLDWPGNWTCAYKKLYFAKNNASL
ncbi:MAG: hypothetical protein HY810_10600 [Candidatus Omnitrophica bacterium]|nr:hypothetical protein [Candidatus Omnitrophota bacterium]